MPFLLNARHGGRAATHAVVKDGVALVGIGAHEVSDERNGLLRRVKAIRVFSILQHIGLAILAYREVKCTVKCAVNLG